MHLEQRREVEVKEQAWREVEERQAIKLGVAIERHERQGQEEVRGDEGGSRASRPDLGPFRSRSNRNATRPLAMIPNGLGRLFQIGWGGLASFGALKDPRLKPFRLILK